MSMWLKQSTSVTVQFGPFLDKTNGVDLETGLATAMDNATTGIRVSKNGAAFIDRNSATAPSYDAMGCYRINLSTTDTNALGTLRIIFEEAATCLPVWMDFMVIPGNVWDSMFGTDKLEVDMTQIDGQDTDGYNATLKLKQLDIQNSAGSALVAKSTGSNGHGVEAAGNGTGEGVNALGGASGSGIHAVGGTTAGSGLRADAGSGSGGDGVLAQGDGSGEGMSARGGLTGQGIHALGGATSGSGLRTEAQGGGSAGLHAAGATSGDGITAVGGATGRGLRGQGGATSGAGIYGDAQNNNDAGLELVKNGTGKDLDADETDTIIVETGTNIPADIAALNDLSSAGAEAACDASLATYDGPTKTEMDTAHGLLAVPGDAMDLVANAVDDTAVATGAINADAIAANAITAAKVADGTIDAATFAAGAINAAAIATDAVDGDALAASAVDEIWAETEAQPGQETPAATQTMRKILAYLYKFMRNKITNDGSSIEVYDDAGSTVDQKATASEAGGTVTRGEFGTGP